MASSCYVSPLNSCVAVAPSRWTPECEGVQDTVVSFFNQATCVLSSNSALEFSTDGGRSWNHAGTLGPMERAQFWRQSGELWRMRNLVSNHVTGPYLTDGSEIFIVSYGE